MPENRIKLGKNQPRKHDSRFDRFGLKLEAIKRNLIQIVIPRIKSWGKLARLQKLAGFTGRIFQVMEPPSQLSIKAIPKPSSGKRDCQGLTIISANLWHDWPQHRRSLDRLDAFAKLVEEHQADVLLLQEVSRTSKIWTDDWLAQRLGMASVYSRANGHLQGIGFEEGLAVFSRHPLSQPVLRQLSPKSNRLVRRLALGTQVDSPCGRLMAFSVHLSIHGKQNAYQTEQLHNWVQQTSINVPALVGGDFNAGEKSHSIKSLKQKWLDPFRHLNPWADGTTHEIRWPWGKPFKRSRLDYIFLKAEQSQWKILESLHLETPGKPLSDHRAVLLRLAPAYLKN